MTDLIYIDKRTEDRNRAKLIGKLKPIANLILDCVAIIVIAFLVCVTHAYFFDWSF